jgi:hypothetical protein
MVLILNIVSSVNIDSNDLDYLPESKYSVNECIEAEKIVFEYQFNLVIQYPGQEDITPRDIELKDDCEVATINLHYTDSVFIVALSEIRFLSLGEILQLLDINHSESKIYNYDVDSFGMHSCPPIEDCISPRVRVNDNIVVDFETAIDENMIIRNLFSVIIDINFHLKGTISGLSGVDPTPYAMTIYSDPGPLDYCHYDARNRFLPYYIDNLSQVVLQCQNHYSINDFSNFTPLNNNYTHLQYFNNGDIANPFTKKELLTWSTESYTISYNTVSCHNVFRKALDPTQPIYKSFNFTEIGSEECVAFNHLNGESFSYSDEYFIAERYAGNTCPSGIYVVDFQSGNYTLISCNGADSRLKWFPFSNSLYLLDLTSGLVRYDAETKTSTTLISRDSLIERFGTSDFIIDNSNLFGDNILYLVQTIKPCVGNTCNFSAARINFTYDFLNYSVYSPKHWVNQTHPCSKGAQFALNILDYDNISTSPQYFHSCVPHIYFGNGSYIDRDTTFIHKKLSPNDFHNWVSPLGFDSDNDRVDDWIDHCIELVLDEQYDSNGDGCFNYEDYRRPTDLDFDGDGVEDRFDLCQNGVSNWSNFRLYAAYPYDHDGDGCHDYIEDFDDDGDGIIDLNDSCPLGLTNRVSHPNNDFDGDGCLDQEDEDDDNDEIKDSSDKCQFSGSLDEVESDGCVLQSSTSETSTIIGISTGVILLIITAVVLIRRTGGSTEDERLFDQEPIPVNSPIEIDAAPEIVSQDTNPPESEIGVLGDDGYYWLEWPSASDSWYYRGQSETIWTYFEK